MKVILTILIYTILIFAVGSASSVYMKMQDRVEYEKQVEYANQLALVIQNRLGNLSNIKTDLPECFNCKIEYLNINDDGAFEIFNSDPGFLIKFTPIKSNKEIQWSCVSYPSNFNMGVGKCKSP